jgi:hypothetical protein
MPSIYDIEMTDTFAGEANYCWVKRGELEAPATLTRLALVRRAKALMGLNGVPCRTYDHGDMVEIRPRSACIVMFVHYRY